MSLLSFAGLSAPAAFPRPMPLRIDVKRPAQQIRDELQAYGRRLADAGPPAEPPGGVALPPGFRTCERRTGEVTFIYVEGIACGRLVGYVALHPLPEAGRRAAAAVRLPHALFHPDFQRRGLGSAIYGAVLARGIGLVSGARQSVAAHALWRALGRRHTLVHVQVRRRALAYLGSSVSATVLDDLRTRLLLLPPGMDVAAFARRTDMLDVPTGR